MSKAVYLHLVSDLSLYFRDGIHYEKSVLRQLSSDLLIAIFLILLFQDVNYQQCYKRGGISSGPRANSRGKANTRPPVVQCVLRHCSWAVTVSSVKSRIGSLT